MITSGTGLDGKTAIVTGGASGIGRRTVEILRELGARVSSVDRSHDSRTEVDALHCDLADVTEIRAAVRTITGARGSIDILVNCAGIVGPKATVADVGEQEWDLVHAVNLKSAVFLTQAVIPHLARGGRIVNVSSAAAHRAAASSVAYASSKGAIEVVTRILAGELANREVNVNAVAPGVTATAIYADDTDEARAARAAAGTVANLFGRVADPDDIAEVIVFLCLPESRQITGQIVHASAGSIV